jgi:hypothetical protein
MQPTIHLENKAGYGRSKNPALPSKCIVGCIFNSEGLIISGKIPCESMISQQIFLIIQFGLEKKHIQIIFSQKKKKSIKIDPNSLK